MTIPQGKIVAVADAISEGPMLATHSAARRAIEAAAAWDHEHPPEDRPSPPPAATISVDFEDPDEAERALEAIVELLGNMGQIGTVSMVRHTTVEEESG